MKKYLLFCLAGFLCLNLNAQAQSTDIEAIFVGNNKGGSISIIDANTLEVIDELNIIPDKEAQENKRQTWINGYVNRKLGAKYVDDMDVLPDGQTIVVSRPAYADIAAFNLNTKELLWTIPLKKRPDHQVMTKDGKYLFVSMLLNSEGLKIDLEKQKVVGSYKTGKRPHSIVLNSDESLVYNGSLKGNNIVVVDTKTLEQKGELPFPEGVRPFKISDDETTIYAQLSYCHCLAEYDLEQQAVVRRVDLPVPEFVESIPLDDYPFDAAHHGIGLSDDRQLISIAGTISNYVAILSFPEMDLLAYHETGIEPSWITNGFDGDTFFVSSRKDDTVYVFSYHTLEKLKAIPVGAYPQRMTRAVWCR
ncbi:MAG: hypothetical protein AAF598_19325 [Bacteroidota bacterium]